MHLPPPVSRSVLLHVALALAGPAGLAPLPAQAARQTEEQMSSPGRYSYHYLLYLPPGYDGQSGERWPLLIMLHGSGAVGSDTTLMSLAGPGLRIEQGGDFPAVVVSPQSTVYYWDPAQLEAFIEDLLARYRLDADRVCLTGMSMGGFGTWNLATAYPDTFAAIVPVCGGGAPNLAARLRDVPVWAFHGALDGTVAVAQSQQMVDAVLDAGGDARLTIYPDVGHDSWVRAYADPATYAWMFAQNRSRLPQIVRAPSPAVAPAGANASFTVSAAGTGLSYRWRKDGFLLAATTSVLELPAVTAADAGDYSVVVSSARGSVASVAVPLTVQSAPAILDPPVGAAVARHSPAIFRVGASGGELRYAWRHDGAELAGATGAVLEIPDATEADAGRYAVTVTNPRGSITSEPVRLDVAGAESAARLVNLSVRAMAGSGDQTLILGLTVGGADRTTGLPVLLRGVGPGLLPIGVAGAMEDPAVVVFRGANPLARNADWAGEPALAAATVRVGAFALDASGRDAALQLCLVRQGYTMHVASSLPGRSGIALLECYDACGAASARTPRLVNLSARATVSGGDGALIAGFVVAGPGTLRILVRGIGPALAASGVSGVLADPHLRLFRGGSVIAENEDWANDPALRDAFAAVGAGRLDGASKDAALLVTLPAGVYTAHVTGRDATSGVALVDLFVVP